MKYLVRFLVVLLVPVILVLWSAVLILAIFGILIQDPIMFIMKGRFPNDEELLPCKWLEATGR